VGSQIPSTPEFGSIFFWPSSMSMNQRVSLYCCESALSPVSSARSSRSWVSGETELRACRTIASTKCGLSASCGLYAAPNGVNGGCWVSSTNSTRPGDSSSTTWKSESWRKLRIEPSIGGGSPSPW
jgi:hypothetical protein